MSNVQPVPAAPPASVEFRYTQTDSFPAALRELGASLAITTYQANKLLIARAGRFALKRTGNLHPCGST